MILLIDNYDSFTYNLVDYLSQLQLKVVVHRNDSEDKALFSDEYQAIVLSPGPGTPEKSGKLMRIIDFYIQRIPILGICLGHQAIVSYFSGNITKAVKPMHGKTNIIEHNGDQLFTSIPQLFRVVRYHSLICNYIPSTLQVIAKAGNEVMGIKHKSLPVYGLQFHPEAYLTDFGLKLLFNWKNICITHN